MRFPVTVALSLLTSLGALGLQSDCSPGSTVVLSMVLPEVPVTVMGKVPMAVDEATVIDMIDVPVPVMVPGLKPTVTPAGWPLAVKVIEESKPFDTRLAIVVVPELPRTTLTAFGEG